MSNNIGLFPGGVSGVYGYRRELEGQRTRLKVEYEDASRATLIRWVALRIHRLLAADILPTRRLTTVKHA